MKAATASRPNAATMTIVLTTPLSFSLLAARTCATLVRLAADTQVPKK
jgi:hypothetical protein